MKNIEGIRISETPEQIIERKSITIDENKDVESVDDENYEACRLTTEDKLQQLHSLKDEVLYYNNCVKQPQEDEIDEDYESCRKK